MTAVPGLSEDVPIRDAGAARAAAGGLGAGPGEPGLLRTTRPPGRQRRTSIPTPTWRTPTAFPPAKDALARRLHAHDVGTHGASTRMTSHAQRLYAHDDARTASVRGRTEVPPGGSPSGACWNKHIMIDLGTGNNNKINWAMEDKQEMVDIIETVYRGARKGRGLVVSPKDYSTKYRY
ncbi:thioredoxin-like protein 4A isoform X2 [Callithrix jacchus]